YFRNDRAGVRLDDLRAIVKVTFESVIMRRVVAGGDHDAGAGPKIPNRKRQFRRRSRSFEDRGIASILRRRPGRQLRKLFRVMPRIMRDHDLWPAFDLLPLAPLEQISDEPLGRAAHVVKIHRVRPDAGKFRRFTIARAAPFRFRHDLADRASAQPTGPEREGAEEAIVQLHPFLAIKKFADNGAVEWRFRTANQSDNIRDRGFS